MCNLKQSIISCIFNFKKFIPDKDIEKFLTDLEDLSFASCHCEDSPFKYQDHCHMLTRSLKIVNYNKLPKISSQCPNYKEPQRLDFQ